MVNIDLHQATPAGVIGSENSVQFTRNPQHTTLTGGSIITLPNAKPASPQLTFTVASGWFPTITQVSGNPLSLIEYFGVLLIGGSNNSLTNTRTFNAEITHTRGESSHVFAEESAAVLATTKTFALNFRHLTGDYAPQVGDVITVKLWCSESSSDMVVSRHNFIIQTGKLAPVNDTTKVLKDVYYDYNNPSLSGWTSNYTGQKYYKKVLKTGDITPPSTAIRFDLDRETANGVTYHEILTTPSSVILQHESQFQYQVLSVIDEFKWSETNFKVAA